MVTSIQRIILGFAIACVVMPMYAANLDASQKSLLAMSHAIGAENNLPETMQAILYVETLAGKAGRIGAGKKAFGVTQVKPITAMEMIEKNNNLNRHCKHYSGVLHALESLEDYKKALISNDIFALRVGACYLKRNYSLVGRDWRRAIVSYYEGVSGSKKLTDNEINNHFYLQRVRQALKKIVRPFNVKKKENRLTKQTIQVDHHSSILEPLAALAFLE